MSEDVQSELIPTTEQATHSPSAESTLENISAAPRPPAEQPIQSATERQVPEQRWQVFPVQKSQAKHVADATALSELLAQVLINRGIYTPEQAWEFLDPETLLLPSPLDEFPDLVKSLDLLVDAIATKEKILICGDYDADGMTSTALLMRSLRYLGASVNYAIPSRMAEGYGINLRMVEEFHEIGGRIILTVDNGIAAYDPVARAKELGLTVILTDHHDVPEQIPPADAILNPKLIRESSPYRGVAGVGVAYILAVCLAQRLGQMQDLTATLLALFTLGTIADLAPLTGVNRRWVKRGLKLLPKSRIPGVQALIEVAGLSEETALRPEAIGFRLGPRINAVGRISDPQIVIDLLTTDDVGVALQRAMQCEEANQLRRQMCEIIETQAVEWCEAQIAAGTLNLKKERVLVVVQPEWHHGVIGIVASRLVERYGVPVFIGTYEDSDKKEIRGSARSIPEFNVFEALQFCDDLLDKHGGHRAAGGFSFQASKLRQVKSRLSNFARKHLQPEHLKPLVTVDVHAPLSAINLDLFAQIDQIHPCGIENPEPVFWTANAAVVEQKVIGKTSDHLKLTIAHTAPGEERKTAIKAIAWRWGRYHPLPRTIDIAYKLRLNEWRGKRSVELEIVGVRPAKPLDASKVGIRPWTETPLKPAPSHRDPADTRSAHPPTPAPAETNLAPAPKTTSLQAARDAARSLQQEIKGAQTTAGSESSPVLFKLPPKLPKLEQVKATNSQAAAPTATDKTAPSRSSRKESSHPSDSSLSAYTGKASEEIIAPLDLISDTLEKSNKQIPNFTSATDIESSLHVEFYYSKRCYKGTLEKIGEAAGSERQITIENAEGHLLVVQMSQRQGFLYLPGEPAQAVDIAELRYFNLIRAGLSALEIKQKNQLMMKQTALLSEKDRQISTMKAQIELLEEKITQLSAEQQQQFAALKTEMHEQETAILDQEAHIEQLQVQVSSVPISTAADIKQQVRDAIGDGVWFCLQTESQQDLQAAYKNAQLIYTSSPDASIADYSEAGMRLSAAIEREVLTPFFQAIYSYLDEHGVSKLGDITLGPAKQYQLSMMPPLLAPQWRSVQSGQLSARKRPESGVKMVKVKGASQLSERDRTLINQFLAQWEHPMALCLCQKGGQAASSLDQISKLRSIAVHAESFLYRWQYELLHQLIAGKKGKGGLLRQLFALS